MKRIPFILIFAFTALFIGCGEDEGPTAPPISAPSHLSATVLSHDQVQLHWADNSLNESGFNIERAPGGTTSWARIGSVGYDTTAFIDQSLSEGTKYRYQVKAFRSDGESDPTEFVEVRTPSIAPTDLTAEQDQDNLLQINLSWNDISGVETGYEIQRKYGRDFETIDTLDADATSYQDEGLVPNVAYQYRVGAMLDSVTHDSSWSNEASAITAVLTPNPPSNLEATTSHINPNQVRLDWLDNSSNETGFVIQRCIPQEVDWAIIDSVGANRFNYTDYGLETETTYNYRIYAYNEHGASTCSNVAEATTPEGPPIAPTNLRTDTLQLAYNRVVLIWDDNSDDELWFNIQRRVEPNRWEDLDQVDADIVTYIDNSVAQSTTYQYRVNAENNVDASEWSNILAVTTPPGPPSPPRDLQAEAMGLDRIRLTWRDVSGNEDNFLIERKAEGEDEFFEHALTEENSMYYLDTGLEAETWYAYRVRAINVEFTSDPSDADSAQTWSLTVFVDDFESDPLDQPPDDPAWRTMEVGNSWIQVSGQMSHGSTKSVRLHDEIETNSWCRLTLNHRQTQRAVASCWLYIPANSYLGVWGADNAPNNVVTFQIQFNRDNTFFVRNGPGPFLELGGDSYPIDQWFHLEIFYDTETSQYDVAFSGVTVVEDRNFQVADHRPEVMLIFTTFTGDASLLDGYMDDVSVTILTDEEESLGPFTEMPYDEVEGAIRITDTPVILQAK